MTESPRAAASSAVPAWCRRLVALAAALVPDAARADWHENAPGPSWNARYLTLIGRLKPGVTADEATEELKSIAAAIKERWPNADPDDIAERGTVVSLHEQMVGDARPTLAALAGSTRRFATIWSGTSSRCAREDAEHCESGLWIRDPGSRHW